MFKYYRLCGVLVLSLSLCALMGACGGGAVGEDYVPSTANGSSSLMGLMEQYLNEGKAAQAVELFSEDALLVKTASVDTASEKKASYYNQGGYYLSLAHDANQIVYRGKAEIKTFLTSLPQTGIHYICKDWSEAADEVSWGCWTQTAGQQMKFRAGIEEGKINLLVTTDS